MRTKKSLINMSISFLSYLIIMLGSFVSRGAFSRILGLDIVGIEGTFINIVSMLGIVEMGLGVSIVYKLYKPIAENDYAKIASILNFLRKAYRFIAACVLTLGVSISFFVGGLIKEDFSKSWLTFIFILYVCDVLASYLFAYKRAMFIADQRNYVNSISHTIMQVATFVLQIAILLLFKSYVGYLLIKIGCRVMENLIISFVYNKKYAYIDLRHTKRMPKAERNDLFSNIKAMLLHKIAGFSLTSTSNMITTYFVNLKATGIYSNYMLIVNALIAMSNELFYGILASFGNLINTESKEKAYANFESIFFINYLVYSFFTVSFFNIVNAFIHLWIGKDSVFPLLTVILITTYLYMMGMRQSVLMAKTSAGIYKPDQYFAITEAVLTFVLALLLVKKLGVAGVILGNIISMFLIPFWTQPFLVYKNVFNVSVRKYYAKYVLYTVFTVGMCFATFCICSLIPAKGILKVVANAVVCLIVPNTINILVFYKTKEFQYLKTTSLDLLNSFRKKNDN